MTKKELIDIVANEHKTDPYKSNDNLIETKQKLLTENKSKYDRHINSINDNSKKEFSEIFDDYQKTTAQKYMQNFNKKYNKWNNR